MSDQVTISKEDYDMLQMAAKKLNALEMAGVSDWEWYYDAVGSVEDQSDDDDDGCWDDGEYTDDN